MELVVIMDIGLFIAPADYSAVSASLSALSEKGQLQQPDQNETFSALLKDVAQDLFEEQLPPFSYVDDPGESASLAAAGDSSTGGVLSGIAVASVFEGRDPHETVSPVADKEESVQSPTGVIGESVDSTFLLSQGLSMVAPRDGGTLGPEPVPTDPPKPGIMDSSNSPLPQPVLDHAQLSDISATHAGSQALDAPSIRNDGGVPADRSPAPLKQPSGNSTLPSTPPPSFPISDQRPVPLTEDQGERNLLSTVSVDGGIQSLDRLSIEVQPSAKVHAQVTEEPVLPGQSLPASVIGDSGGRGQDLFEADAQGGGEGAFFDFRENRAPESVTRDNQFPFFNGQFTSARQAQSSTDGESSSVVTLSAILGEDHSSTMTSVPGKAQAVHVELPSHNSGPLSVRISMTDQTVHTQFTTDRNDLGALLFMRQDQLQQNLAKSGLELGQFQVHIDQQGRQEALPDRQSRRNGGASEQQPASQDHNQQAQDRERPNHRSSRALSLFA